MIKQRIAALIVGGSLVLSAGYAFAEEGADPVLEDVPTSTTTPVEEAPEPVVEDVEGVEDVVTEDPAVEEVVTEDPVVEEDPEPVTEVVEEDPEPVVEAEGGEHPDNHGKVVSQAAKNHEHDEACGNHGRYVSHVARTGEEPECAAGVDEEPTS